MSPLAGCVIAIILSISLMLLSAHYIKFNKTAGAGVWYAVWWWVAAIASLCTMVAVITTGTVIQRIYF